VGRAVRFHGGDLNPHFFNWPSLFMFLLWPIYGAVAALGGEGVAQAFTADPAIFYLIGRLVTVAFAAATVGGLGVLARTLYGWDVGLLAGSFLAVDLLHVHDSRFVTTDVPMTALVVLGLALTLRYWRHGRRRDVVLSGLVTGLAASMKYPGALACVSILLACIFRADGTRPWWRRLSTADLGWAGAAAVAGFLVGTPFALLSPAEFWRGLADEIVEVNAVQFGNEADLPALPFHLVHSLPTAMGMPLALLAAVGLGLALVRGRAAEAIWLAFPLPYLLVIGTWSSRFERYTVPLLPFTALLAALAVVRLVDLARAHLVPLGRVSPRTTVTVVAGLLLVSPVMRLVTFHRLLARPDTREVATGWIERQLPPGTRIAVEPYGPSLPVTSELLRTSRRAATLDFARSAGEGAGAVAPVVPAEDGAGGYWVLRLNAYDLGWLQRERVEYIVLSSFVYRRHLQACARYPVPCRFYADLDRRGTLVVTVPSGADDGPLWVGDIYAPLTRLGERARPGPTLKIYRLPVGP
jgi:Dolichyl-phosphate-mannose-protein mannosyltransferase